ncbi:hypothetical protein HBI13_149960 [Parastagonospora nodorum]|nr:hypothetical protein HBI10_001950 [Parastagonospora nodorum]KAH4016569.1 hypothetical protein HBI13_149960 [Parastagonospora nodorum]KAH4821014.1 hypothetical protein HBH61_021190 [Parastagonospora nodorum]KAH4930679.1 hypothetical protein HBI79_113570 [Parastagonospora nodorum]KAH5695743.1 hypothetical protein HBI44_118450 [Parastagonospora nodorum]
MAMLPQFSFPLANQSEVSGSAITPKDKPQIQLDTSTNTEIREAYRLAVPGRRHSRPLNLGTVSTPPDSPTRLRSVTLGSQAPAMMHDSGALTPPATPTSHSKSGSLSSDFLTSLSCLRRGDSMSSSTGRPSLDDSMRPGSTDLLKFPHHLTDYSIKLDGEGRKRPIGVGAWSDVYLAKPNLPQSRDIPAAPAMTPPLTPRHSRGASKDSSYFPSIPSMYAIKVPGSTSAKKVLDAEARILSYLSRFPNADRHVVPFFGQDVRTGALVLKALDGTLDDWIEKSVNSLDEPARAAKLAALFPTIALSLIDSLMWMQEKDCIHADIKPSNILVSSAASQLDLVYSDFSSTILTTVTDDIVTPPPMGAGTWEFLDPSLLSSFNPATPCAATDLWSLGITLLFLILGTSPYDAFKANKFQQREMIKSGSPLQCLGYDDQGIVNTRRLKQLSKTLGWDVSKWLGKVLVKSKEKRVSVAAWRAELVQHMAR